MVVSLKTWDVLQDTQGKIALFLAEVDLQNKFLSAEAGLFHAELDLTDEDELFVFVCPAYKIVCCLHGVDNIAPGNLFIKEHGEDPLKIPIIRYSLYDNHASYLKSNLPRSFSNKSVQRIKLDV